MFILMFLSGVSHLVCCLVMQNLTDQDWKKKLTPEQYRVLREKGTEPAFTGELLKNHDDGMYHCVGCGARLFSSESKFDSGSGWPSFDRAHDEGSIEFVEDRSHGMLRTEIVCANCRGHLGHVFQDGPTSTGKRFCVNSTSLNFQKQDNV